MLVRTDAHERIGTGHLVRCAALASTWRAAGGTAEFLTFADSDSAAELIARAGATMTAILSPHPDPDDARRTRARLDALDPGDVVVIDGYHFGHEYHRAIADERLVSLVIDDNLEQATDCADIVLNQNVGGEWDCTGYGRATPLLGPSYALLRPIFWRFREWTRGDAPKSPVRILVTMGSTDPDNFTGEILQVARDMNPDDVSFTLLIGPANPHRHELVAASAGTPHIDCVVNPTDVAAVMAASDMAVTAAGSTCWELCFMMVPMLTVHLATNHNVVTDQLTAAGAARHLGNGFEIPARDIAEAIEHLASDVRKRHEMAQNGRWLVDGQGAERVVETLCRIASVSA